MTVPRSALVALVLVAGFVSSYVAFAAYGGTNGIRIPYNGVLERNGVLLSGDVDFVFSVFNEEVDGTACYTSAPIPATVTSGRFAVVVGPVTSTCIVNRDVFLEVAADDGAGLSTLGRQRIHPALAAVSSGSGDFAVGGTLTAAGAIAGSSLTVSGGVTAATVNTTGNVTWPNGELRQDNNGAIELGGVSKTPYFDFHGGPTFVDYDARLILTSADQLRLQGAELLADNGIRFADNTVQTTAAKSLSCTAVESTALTGNGLLETSVAMTAGYQLTGGGCREDAIGDRQLMRSYAVGNTWYCASRDEDNLYTGSLKAYAVGCRLQ